ncbi:MAG: DUF2169 domain-containing protein [Polyangiaceae bacterium]
MGQPLAGPGPTVGQPPSPPRLLDPWRRPARFGTYPIPPDWPSRARLLKGAPAPAPSADLPRDFPWSYFQSAPEDQRIPFLAGDEWIRCEGVHSQLPRIDTSLPGIYAGARVHADTPDLREGRYMALHADTLIIDMTRMVLSVVWRASFIVPDPQAAYRIFAGAGTRDRPLTFPATADTPPISVRIQPPPPSGRAPQSAPRPSQPGTAAIGDEITLDEPDSPAAGALPFDPAVSTALEAAPATADLREALFSGPRPALPFIRTPAEPTDIESPDSYDDSPVTLVMQDSFGADGGEVLPFIPSAPPSRRGRAAHLPPATPFDTLLVGSEVPLPDKLPFAEKPLLVTADEPSPPAPSLSPTSPLSSPSTSPLSPRSPLSSPPTLWQPRPLPIQKIWTPWKRRANRTTLLATARRRISAPARWVLSSLRRLACCRRTVRTHLSVDLPAGGISASLAPHVDGRHHPASGCALPRAPPPHAAGEPARSGHAVESGCP